MGDIEGKRQRLRGCLGVVGSHVEFIIGLSGYSLALTICLRAFEIMLPNTKTVLSWVFEGAKVLIDMKIS